MDDLQKMMGGVPKQMHSDLINYYKRSKKPGMRNFRISDDKEYDLPKSFKWTETWPGNECQVEVQEQGECGACYAFASTAMLAERLCIDRKRRGLSASPSLLSTQFVISCDALDFGCDGGHLPKTMDFLTSQPIP